MINQRWLWGLSLILAAACTDQQAAVVAGIAKGALTASSNPSIIPSPTATTIPTPAPAETISLRVVVLDADKQPLSGAQVTVKTLDGTILHRLTVSKSGNHVTIPKNDTLLYAANLEGFAFGDRTWVGSAGSTLEIVADPKPPATSVPAEPQQRAETDGNSQIVANNIISGRWAFKFGLSLADAMTSDYTDDNWQLLLHNHPDEQGYNISGNWLGDIVLGTYDADSGALEVTRGHYRYPNIQQDFVIVSYQGKLVDNRFEGTVAGWGDFDEDRFGPWPAIGYRISASTLSIRSIGPLTDPQPLKTALAHLQRHQPRPGR